MADSCILHSVLVSKTFEPSFVKILHRNVEDMEQQKNVKGGQMDEWIDRQTDEQYSWNPRLFRGT